MPVSIGLDIGTSAVRAAQIASGGRGPDVLQRLAEVPLPPDAVREGDIVDADAVVAALKELWARHRFGGRDVALGVANQQVVVRQVELPWLPPKELRQSLQFQAADAIPIPVEHAILDFHLLERVEAPDGQTLARVLLVAAHRDMVETLVDVVRRAGLAPTVLDLDAFAVLRSLAPASLLGGEGELLVDCGAGVTDVVVHAGGIPRFVRMLPRGGQAVTQAIAAALDVDEDAAEAAKAGARASFTATGAATTLTEEATRVAAEHTSRLVDDLRGSLEFYASQRDAVPVRRVVLSGGASRLTGLREAVAEGLDLPVAPGHPMQELKIGRIGLDAEALVRAEPHVAVAVGLGLADRALRERGRA